MSKQQNDIHSATIFIVDDNEELSQALATNLQTEGYQTKTFTSAETFLENYSENTLGCLLLDVRMPGMTGNELQQKLIEREIKTPIVFMSGYSDVPVAVGALKKGAIDFLTKPIDQQTLIKTINKALQEDIKRREQEQNNEETSQRAASLTKREREIMELIVKGKLNKIIAYDLDISMNTVENHRAKIMSKMNANTVAELVCICLLNGVVEIQNTKEEET